MNNRREFNAVEVKHSLNNDFNLGYEFFFTDSIIEEFNIMDNEKLQYIASELIYILNEVTLMDNNYFLSELEYYAIGKTGGRSKKDHRDYHETIDNLKKKRKINCETLKNKVDNNILDFEFIKNDNSWRKEDIVIFILFNNYKVKYENFIELSNIIKSFIKLCCLVLVANENCDMFDIKYFEKYNLRKKISNKLPKKNTKTKINKI